MDINGRYYPILGPDGSRIPRPSDEWEIPHVFSFASMIKTVSSVYWQQMWDEAVKHSRSDALRMRNDCGLMALLQERKLAVASLNWNLACDDEKDLQQVQIRDHLKKTLETTRGFQMMIWNALEALWYGRQGMQISWGEEWKNKVRTSVLREWLPINGDKIGYTFDHKPYVLISTKDSYLYRDSDLVQPIYGGKGVLIQNEFKDHVVIHSHEIEDADYFDAPAGDSVHGVGIRSRVFWIDWIDREWLSWISDFIQRFGLGTTMWYYDASNPAAKDKVREAAKNQTDRTNLLVPRWGGQNVPAVERVETPATGSQILMALRDNLYRMKERYVVGQSMSANATGGGGLGNEAAAEFQWDTKRQIRNFDAKNLAESITGDEDKPGIIYLMQKRTFPETIPSPRNQNGFRIRFQFDLDKHQSTEKLNAATTLISLGIPVKKDDLYVASGLSKPGEGDDIVTPPQPQMGTPGSAQPQNSGSAFDSAGRGKVTAQDFRVPEESPQAFSRRGNPQRYMSDDRSGGSGASIPVGGSLSSVGGEARNPRLPRVASQSRPLEPRASVNLRDADSIGISVNPWKPFAHLKKPQPHPMKPYNPVDDTGKAYDPVAYHGEKLERGFSGYLLEGNQGHVDRLKKYISTMPEIHEYLKNREYDDNDLYALMILGGHAEKDPAILSELRNLNGGEDIHKKVDEYKAARGKSPPATVVGPQFFSEITSDYEYDDRTAKPHQLEFFLDKKDSNYKIAPLPGEFGVFRNSEDPSQSLPYQVVSAEDEDGRWHMIVQLDHGAEEHQRSLGEAYRMGYEDHGEIINGQNLKSILDDPEKILREKMPGEYFNSMHDKMRLFRTPQDRKNRYILNRIINQIVHMSPQERSYFVKGVEDRVYKRPYGWFDELLRVPDAGDSPNRDEDRLYNFLERNGAEIETFLHDRYPGISNDDAYEITSIIGQEWLKKLRSSPPNENNKYRMDYDGRLSNFMTKFAEQYVKENNVKFSPSGQSKNFSYGPFRGDFFRHGAPFKYSTVGPSMSGQPIEPKMVRLGDEPIHKEPVYFKENNGGALDKLNPEIVPHLVRIYKEAHPDNPPKKHYTWNPSIGPTATYMSRWWAQENSPYEEYYDAEKEEWIARPYTGDTSHNSITYDEWRGKTETKDQQLSDLRGQYGNDLVSQISSIFDPWIEVTGPSGERMRKPYVVEIPASASDEYAKAMREIDQHPDLVDRLNRDWHQFVDLSPKEFARRMRILTKFLRRYPFHKEVALNQDISKIDDIGGLQDYFSSEVLSRGEIPKIQAKPGFIKKISEHAGDRGPIHQMVLPSIKKEKLPAYVRPGYFVIFEDGESVIPAKIMSMWGTDNLEEVGAVVQFDHGGLEFEKEILGLYEIGRNSKDLKPYLQFARVDRHGIDGAFDDLITKATADFKKLMSKANTKNAEEGIALLEKVKKLVKTDQHAQALFAGIEDASIGHSKETPGKSHKAYREYPGYKDRLTKIILDEIRDLQGPGMSRAFPDFYRDLYFGESMNEALASHAAGKVLGGDPDYMSVINGIINNAKDLDHSLENLEFLNIWLTENGYPKLQEDHFWRDRPDGMPEDVYDLARSISTEVGIRHQMRKASTLEVLKKTDKDIFDLAFQRMNDSEKYNRLGGKMWAMLAGKMATSGMTEKEKSVRIMDLARTFLKIPQSIKKAYLGGSTTALEDATANGDPEVRNWVENQTYLGVDGSSDPDAVGEMEGMIGFQNMIKAWVDFEKRTQDRLRD